MALAVGRLLPGLARRALAVRALGIGYGLLSVAILLVGAIRQRRAASALARARSRKLELSPRGLADRGCGGALGRRDHPRRGRDLTRSLATRRAASRRDLGPRRKARITVRSVSEVAHGLCAVRAYP